MRARKPLRLDLRQAVSWCAVVILFEHKILGEDESLAHLNRARHFEAGAVIDFSHEDLIVGIFQYRTGGELSAIPPA